MATKYWLGSTAQVPQVYTITITGTWAAGDYINIYPPSLYHRETGSAIGQGCKITMGSSGLTVANVADKVYRAFGASAHDDNLLDDESRNLGGQEMPELAEFSASYPGTGAVVTVTGPPGVAAYFYMALNTAGDGSLTQATVQSATGKWFWDNGENWSGGGVPTNNDTVYFDHRSKASCLFGLPYNSMELAALYVQMGFAGRQLGLPAMNRLDYETGRPKPQAAWYPEWRQRRPVFDDAGSGTNPEFIIGQGSGAGPRYVNIEQVALASKLTVHRTGTPLPNEQYVVAFNSDVATSGSTACVYGGSVALSPDAVTDRGRYKLVDVGRGATVYIGPSADLAAISTITMNGGFVRCDTADFGLIPGEGANIKVLGGTLELSEGATTTTVLRVFHPGVCFYSGNKSYVSGAIDSAYISGTLSFARATEALDWSVVDPIQLMRGARILDPQRKMSWSSSNGIDLVGCGLGSVTLQLGQNITITKLANDP